MLKFKKKLLHVNDARECSCLFKAYFGNSTVKTTCYQGWHKGKIIYTFYTGSPQMYRYLFINITFLVIT